MKKFLILVLFPTMLLAQSIELTLSRSLEAGLANSKEIQLSLSQIKYDESLISEINSQMLPSVNIMGRFIRLSDIPPFEVKLPFLAEPVKIQDAVLNNYNLQMSFEQPLFTGFGLSSLKSAAVYRAASSEIELEKVKNEKAHEIKTAFWNFFKARKLIELVESGLNSLKKHLKDAENFLDNGLITKSDLLKLKVQTANTELKLIEAQNTFETARSIFNRAIGFDLRAKTELKEELKFNEINFDYNTLIEEALQNRCELISLNNMINAGKENVAAAGSTRYPQIFAFGNYYFSRPNARILPLKDEFADTWDLGVGMRWNIWDWGKSSAKISQAEEMVFQAEKNMELLKEYIALEVNTNYLKLKSENQKITASALEVEAAEENYRITSEKFNEQLSAASELIDADVELLRAKTNLINALIDNEIAIITLEKSVGRKLY